MEGDLAATRRGDIGVIPGIYDMPAAQYHADPCPTPSLSSTGAAILASECPAVLKYKMDYPEKKRVFDIGTAAHLMMLEPTAFNNAVSIIDGKTKDGRPSTGYTTKEAKDQRQAAYDAGKIPLLPNELDMLMGMRAALRADPIGGKAFRDGKAEQSIFWRDGEFGIWCRSRPDWIPDHGRYAVNYKTAESANPEDVARAIYIYGYYQKAAWEMDAIEAVRGERPSKFCLLVQAKRPPYLVIPVWIHTDDLAWGCKLNHYARGVFAWCLETGKWPGFSEAPGDIPHGFDNLRIPFWARKQLEERDAEGRFEPPQYKKRNAE